MHVIFCCVLWYLRNCVVIYCISNGLHFFSAAHTLLRDLAEVSDSGREFSGSEAEHLGNGEAHGKALLILWTASFVLAIMHFHILSVAHGSSNFWNTCHNLSLMVCLWHMFVLYSWTYIAYFCMFKPVFSWPLLLCPSLLAAHVSCLFAQKCPVSMFSLSSPFVCTCEACPDMFAMQLFDMV